MSEEWKIYQDAHFDLRADWKYRTCPECGSQGARHSCTIIIGSHKGYCTGLPVDTCGLCAYLYGYLSRMEW